jgi:hypothetical protein
LMFVAVPSSVLARGTLAARAEAEKRQSGKRDGEPSSRKSQLTWVAWSNCSVPAAADMAFGEVSGRGTGGGGSITQATQWRKRLPARSSRSVDLRPQRPTAASTSSHNLSSRRCTCQTNTPSQAFSVPTLPPQSLSASSHCLRLTVLELTNLCSMEGTAAPTSSPLSRAAVATFAPLAYPFVEPFDLSLGLPAPRYSPPSDRDVSGAGPNRPVRATATGRLRLCRPPLLATQGDAHS